MGVALGLALVCILSVIGSVWANVCPNGCSGHGLCNKYSACECAAGFMGGDCSLKICPFGAAWADQAIANDTAHLPAECSNRGICDRSQGVCTCQSGFVGTACERLACPADCSSNGECISMYNYARTMRNSLSVRFRYDLVWDANKIWGCICDDKYENYYCSWRICPKGDDPLTTKQINEIQYFRCVANPNSGTFWLLFNGVTSLPILSNYNLAQVKAALNVIPGIGTINVIFSSASSAVCSTSFNVVKVEFLSNFGPQPPLVPVINAAMAQSGGVVDISAAGSKTLADSSGKLYTGVAGSKENDSCSNRGYCSPSDGVCSCYNTNGDAYGSSNGYGVVGTRGDCGTIISGLSVSSCPGASQCNGYGVCSSTTYRCTCQSTFTSGDCSLRTCPLGPSWFSYPSADNTAHDVRVPCSNMGVCDTVSGVCSCRDGFFGEACQYMSCDGTASGFPHCSGNGRCMSMAELAIWADKNGDATDYYYGENPNNAYTWDGKRIYGCLCDPGFSGYDCSLHTCPTGDDPGTYDQSVEVQLLQCIGDSGYITLTFRQATTAIIPVNTTAAGLKAILEALPTLTKLSVYYSRDGIIPPFFEIKNATVPANYVWGNTSVSPYPTANPSPSPTARPTVGTPTSGLCNAAGTNIAIIVFDTIHGDLPPLTANNKQLYSGVQTGKVNIFSDGQSVVDQIFNNGSPRKFTSIKGTTENAPCNNRGICMTTTGVCSCFAGWSSSDGEGNPGMTGDCGYRSRELEN